MLTILASTTISMILATLAFTTFFPQGRPGITMSVSFAVAAVILGIVAIFLRRRSETHLLR